MLTTEQIEAFRRDGYLVIEDVVPSGLRDALEQEYRRVLAPIAARAAISAQPSFLETLRAVHGAGVDWFQALDISLPGTQIDIKTPFHYGPAVHDLLTCPQVLAIVQSLLGSEVTSNPIQHIRIKPPSRTVARDAPVHTTETAWHQDRAVAHAEADDTDMVTVWVAMTNATPANGCLLVQPKEADQEMLPHCPLNQTAIPARFLERSRRRPLPVKAGGIILLDPMTPHAAGPNVSDGLRWSFDLRYQRTGAPTGRAQFPSFPVLPGPAPDWRSVRDRWREARTACAAAPHIPIHRWTSTSPQCA
ncbi:hypothetical protein JANAI62_27900 [Jannaschia pagri]|uniref:Ectoine hydroxylase-related dioxygenase, phytanoyl-CoA dioxygenase (PhyH) family n=1 Tax=Jannaschia pagri TaxID=2829797 RepID=A0ABQ4NP36_9RHOB|nr:MULTISPECIES: phytanoyl-CoA dioxygenase family protein [unclassified Jannaschia]GIT92332.1 hypothetical protein JANAI61_27900 [Jannaschia sp. AI_61]GIT96167.1 hypothetical protein JANAI62_27900 [Jannaschia sp. AI_62]